MKILLDTGIFIHSEFAEGVIQEQRVKWGPSEIIQPVHGFRRKPIDTNAEHQRQKDALFTIGRLIREGRLAPFKYCEIGFELMRAGSSPGCNALFGCRISSCSPAIERSRFRQTINFREMISKGGSKDRKAGKDSGSFSQIPFFSWLCSLTKSQVGAILEVADKLDLPQLEIESLRDIEWFQLLCRRSQSPENYVDVFHLWTAERNNLDAFVVLDGKLQRIVDQVRSERRPPIEIKTAVLKPLDVLKHFGISEPDPVPLPPERFYWLHEMPQN